MFNSFKKKYKFNNRFYILFLFFLITFIKFSTTITNASTYKIINLEISKTYDNDFSKDTVIDIAFKKAFEELILKITTLNEKEVKKLTNIKTIYSLIDSFSIVDEKFTDSKYVSKFDVEFSKKELFKYLEKKNIFPSIPKQQTLLLIPLLINNENKQIILFSENPFYNNWNKSRKKYHLLDYILPNEDIEDINIIKNNIDRIEEHNFKEIVSKYEVDNYIILILFQKGNNFNALMKSSFNKKLIISNKKFNWHENQSIEKIINNLKLDFENQWKKLNIINVSIKLPVTISIDSKNYELIKNFEKKLNNLDLVSSFYVNTINNKNLIYKIIYNSTPSKFINEFSKDNLKLNTDGKIWRIE